MNDIGEVAKKIKENKVLEISILLDCHNIMSKWRNRIKNNIDKIIKNVTEEFSDKITTIKISFIGYSDHEHKTDFEDKSFYIQNFTSDIEKLKTFLTSFEMLKLK